MRWLGLAAAAALLPGLVSAADLPTHDPLRILVIADEVNPHGLSDADLTQPGDLQAALADPASGLNLDGGATAVTLVDSQCIDAALTQLQDPSSVSAVVYFAHQAAQACGGGDQQPALTAAFEDVLQTGGGIVVFHHGVYQASGKEAVLQLLGATAGSIDWDTTSGQTVIDVAPGHFITDNGVTYDQTTTYEDPAAGVAAGDYDAFVNLPDERYPQLDLLVEAGEDRTILFASNYTGGGSGTHVLGYDLKRDGWTGRVVMYQPGEHQPQALDPTGNNFQILVNAIVHASGALGDGGGTSGGTGGTDSGGGPTETSGASDTNSGDASGTGGSSTSGSPGSSTSGDPDPDTDGSTGEAGGGGGGCRVARSPGAPGSSGWLVGVLVWRGRRKHARASPDCATQT